MKDEHEVFLEEEYPEPTKIVRERDFVGNKEEYLKYLKQDNCGGLDFEWYNEDWLLTTKGDMVNAIADYQIEYDRLQEEDWILHLMSKDWFDANTFLPAFFEACRRAGIKKVTITINY